MVRKKLSSFQKKVKSVKFVKSKAGFVIFAGTKPSQRKAIGQSNSLREAQQIAKEHKASYPKRMVAILKGIKRTK